MSALAQDTDIKNPKDSSSEYLVTLEVAEYICSKLSGENPAWSTKEPIPAEWFLRLFNEIGRYPLEGKQTDGPSAPVAVNGISLTVIYEAIHLIEELEAASAKAEVLELLNVVLQDIVEGVAWTKDDLLDQFDFTPEPFVSKNFATKMANLLYPEIKRMQSEPAAAESEPCISMKGLEDLLNSLAETDGEQMLTADCLEAIENLAHYANQHGDLPSLAEMCEGFRPDVRADFPDLPEKIARIMLNNLRRLCPKTQEPAEAKPSTVPNGFLSLVSVGDILQKVPDVNDNDIVPMLMNLAHVFQSIETGTRWERDDIYAQLCKKNRGHVGSAKTQSVAGILADFIDHELSKSNVPDESSPEPAEAKPCPLIDPDLSLLLRQAEHYSSQLLSEVMNEIFSLTTRSRNGELTEDNFNSVKDHLTTYVKILNLGTEENALSLVNEILDKFHDCYLGQEG
jgi:hypothetical protein